MDKLCEDYLLEYDNAQSIVEIARKIAELDCSPKEFSIQNLKDMLDKKREINCLISNFKNFNYLINDVVLVNKDEPRDRIHLN